MGFSLPITGSPQIEPEAPVHPRRRGFLFDLPAAYSFAASGLAAR